MGIHFAGKDMFVTGELPVEVLELRRAKCGRLQECIGTLYHQESLSRSHVLKEAVILEPHHTVLMLDALSAQ